MSFSLKILASQALGFRAYILPSPPNRLNLANETIQVIPTVLAPREGSNWEKTMHLSVAEARALVEAVMKSLGHDKDDAWIIADHIIDSELRGLNYGGLPRVVSIIERIGRTGKAAKPVETMHETPVSARLAGNDNVGYVVAYRATEIAIAKAKASGISMVGADGTWYTGMLSYFAEMAAAEGLLTMIASNASPWVAPHGSVDGRFGTNPICFGFPSTGDPVIWDIGTSSIMHAEVLLARRLGQQIPEGKAFGPDGAPTTDPDTALAGAFTPWGGHKGAGLGMVVQMLGMLAGLPRRCAGDGGFRLSHGHHEAGSDDARGRVPPEGHGLCRLGPRRPPGRRRRPGPHALRPLRRGPPRGAGAGSDRGDGSGSEPTARGGGVTALSLTRPCQSGDTLTRSPRIRRPRVSGDLR